MAAYFALTVVGADMPGILAAVSKVLFEAGCSVGESSMTLVLGEFAMVMVVSAEDQSPEAIREAIVGATPGVTVFIRPIAGERLSAALPTGREFAVSVYGSDRPGIVYRVAKALAEQGVNITDLKTKVIGDAERPVYVMRLEVDIPPGLDPEDVETALKTVAAKLSVNLTMRPLEASPGAGL